jgi:hypothetical protein
LSSFHSTPRSAAVPELWTFGNMSMSDPKPSFTRLDSVKTKIELSEKILQGALQKLRDPDLSSFKRTEIQGIIEDIRQDIARFQKQKDDLERE